MDDTTSVSAQEQRGSSTTRRAVLGVGVGVPLLAACGSDETENGGSGGSADETGDGLTAPTADIPVGGGAIFEDAEVVITQPVEGEFKAFGAVCPHQGCLVSQVTEEGIGCTCHGSRFSLEDGSVQDGPAEEGLTELTASTEGTDVTVG